MLITYYSHLHTFTANKVPNALFQASTYVALGVNFGSSSVLVALY